uniref:LRAT domain-containing protein n=1 Tax=Meleagris gallopavo TaxID=9103 RepID=G1MRQ2_MELGA
MGEWRGVGGEVGATRVGDSRCGCHQAGSGFADPQVSSLLLTLQDKVPPFLQLRYWLRSWMWQAVAGAASTAAFFLCEGLLGWHFDVVPNGAAEPQPGDLFLFPLTSRRPGWWGAHAGVYCGDGEIIHLEGTSGTSPTGIVAKHSKSHLLRTRGPAKVLRMKAGLDAAALQWRIRAAMDMVLEYDAVTCNCIHFALALLGLGQLTGDMTFPVLQ